MNQKLLELLPKKMNPVGNYDMYSARNGYNQALDDCIAALEKTDVAVVPSFEEFCNLLGKRCMNYPQIPYHKDCQCNQCGNVRARAIVIREYMLGEK